MKRIILLLLAAFTFSGAFAQNKIKVYFNKPVDTTVATSTKAVYLNNCIADTLAAYLSRAKYSIDICVYDFEKYFSYNITTLDTVFAPKVAAAIDTAYAHGLKVRFIYDSSNANTGMSLLDTGIHTMGSPQGPNYTIMHNKFVIIDAASPNPSDPIVWTGCLNWYYEQFNWDYNNVIIFQDSALASAYTAEFNMMWGDTGINKNWATSKFGQYKTDLGQHTFYIDGHLVELYFSPSDGTDSHIQSTIQSATKDLYFGEYTFTEHQDAIDIVARFDSGLNVFGINDSYSNSDFPTTQFRPILGTHFKVYTESPDSLYHNKMLIINPSDTCGDPKVLTGSHNWSVSANDENDENTVIVHSDTVANVYLQYFKANFDDLPGSKMTVPAYNCSPMPLKENAVTNVTASGFILPNPSNGNFYICYELPTSQNTSVIICDVTGRKVKVVADNMVQAAGRHSYPCNIEVPGMYFAQIATEEGTITLKATVTR